MPAALYTRNNVHRRHVSRHHAPPHHVSAVNYYHNEIQQCQEMYDKLQLDRHKEVQDRLSMSNPFPMIRGHTMVTQSRPLTYSVRRENRPFSLRSAPVYMFQEDSVLFDDHCAEKQPVLEQQEKTADDAKSESTEYEYDERGKSRKRSRLDPDQLCEHLRQQGLGLPSIVKSDSCYRRVTQNIPRNLRNRALPRNPSKREKVKGRARLDQELANMKAEAFCEQQNTRKVFRTASANMRNRDVQFMEDDLKEHMQKEGFDLMLDEFLDQDDDNASIVRMPVRHEELFVRVNTWVEDVENSCKVYSQLHEHAPPPQQLPSEQT